MDIEGLFTRLYLDYLRLSLYFPGESDLVEQAAVLANYSFEVRREFKRHFGRVKSQLVAEANAHVSGDDNAYRAAVKASDQAARDYNSALEPSIKKMHGHFRRYPVALNAHLREHGTRATPTDDKPAV